MNPVRLPHHILLCGLASLIAGCELSRMGSPTSGAAPDMALSSPPRALAPSPVPPPEAPYTLVRGFYATDRHRTDRTEPNFIYGAERAAAAQLEYGTFQVTIPRDHRLAEMERPSLLRFDFREDPEQHIVLVQVRPRSLDDFRTELSGALGRTTRREVLVFIHGYNVSFDAAARRLGQLVYDLEFTGAPVLYSWPSQAQESKYTFDEAAVEWTVPHLERFLEAVVARSGAEAIHLVAHSMGNRALTRALQLVARRQSPAPQPPFHQIIMAAPDIDAGVFRDLARDINGTASRFTLYASSNDKALQLSKKFHGYPRAGESGDGLVVVPGVDTIDVSRIDTSLLGHSYYGDNTSVVSDVRKILLLNLAPRERCDCLRPAEKDHLPFWVFQP